VPVGVFDMIKGFVPTAFIGPAVSDGALIPLVCGAMAVLGHMFSPFIGFRGGKGAATGAGIIAALAPLAFVAVVGLWAVLVYLTGYVSLATIVAAASFPMLAQLLSTGRNDNLWLEVALAALVIWMHRANIGRLLRGTESRFRRREGP